MTDPISAREAREAVWRELIADISECKNLPMDMLLRAGSGCFDATDAALDEYRDAIRREMEKEHEGDLADFEMIVRHCSEIYDEVSMGRVSKPNTLPSVVLDFLSERLTEAYDEGRSVGWQDAMDQEHPPEESESGVGRDAP